MILDIWKHPATIQRNNFKFKALSSWSYNVAVGCNHACKFCYVPEVSTIRMGSLLKPLGVEDPDEQWGKYVFVRPFNADAFRASLRRAIREDLEGDLPSDGNRAIMFCTTTDPYQTIFHPDREMREKLNVAMTSVVRGALEIIRDESNLNVRILTRSPLASRDFALMATFGNRLMFGMSIPTTNDRLARIYEPNAPAPSKRIQTLQRAAEVGLHTYVAIAPVYPESDAGDINATLATVRTAKPLTVFSEPINIRADNVARIKKHADDLGLEMNTKVFASAESWAAYARELLEEVEVLASINGLHDRLHLWPDAALPGKIKDPAFTEWCRGWWNRKSEWPS